MSEGKGISDAVRGIAPQWFDASTVEKVTKAAHLSAWQARDLRSGKQWTRTRAEGRRKASDGRGWVRRYYCKGINEDDVQLRIRCNADETKIIYFTIVAGGKTIEGGVTNVASVFFSSKDNEARVAAAATAEAKTSGFRRMTAAELQQIQTENDFDTFADMFEQRDS